MMQTQETQKKLNSLAETAQSAQLLDKSAFENLIAETSPEVVWEILTSFKTTLSESVSGLQNSKATPEELYKVCHKLKGSSLLIGFVPLGELCKTAMSDIKTASRDDYLKDVERTLACALQTQKIVNQFTK